MITCSAIKTKQKVKNGITIWPIKVTKPHSETEKDAQVWFLQLNPDEIKNCIEWAYVTRRKDAKN